MNIINRSLTSCIQGGPKKSKPLPIFQKNRIKDCQRD